MVSLIGCLAGCQHSPPHADVPPERWQYQFQDIGKLFGDDLVLKDKKPAISQDLWAGALQALQAFPLQIISPETGVLQTQWIVLQGQPDDRFQIRVIIAPSKDIHVQAVCVTVLHEVRCPSGWQLYPPAKELADTLRRQILLNARKSVTHNKKLSFFPS